MSILAGIAILAVLVWTFKEDFKAWRSPPEPDPLWWFPAVDGVDEPTDSELEWLEGVGAKWD